MKALTLVSLLLLVSCGKYATKDDLNQVDDRVSELENKILELDNKVRINGRAIELMYTSLQTSINSLASEAGLSERDKVAEQNRILAMIQTIQDQTTELAARQASLELEDRVVGIFDPCPGVRSNSYTESLFEMKSGKVVAYFEDGGKRFLTILKTGTVYKTTDSRACTFSI